MGVQHTRFILIDLVNLTVLNELNHANNPKRCGRSLGYKINKSSSGKNTGFKLINAPGRFAAGSGLAV